MHSLVSKRFIYDDQLPIFKKRRSHNQDLKIKALKNISGRIR